MEGASTLGVGIITVALVSAQRSPAHTKVSVLMTAIGLLRFSQTPLAHRARQNPVSNPHLRREHRNRDARHPIRQAVKPPPAPHCHES